MPRYTVQCRISMNRIFTSWLFFYNNDQISYRNADLVVINVERLGHRELDPVHVLRRGHNLQLTLLHGAHQARLGLHVEVVLGANLEFAAHCCETVTRNWNRVQKKD